MTTNELVQQHLRFAWLIARRVGKGELGNRDDFEQAAVIGLFEAARTWDPAQGAFTTWAGWKCRSAVQAEVRRLLGINARPVCRARLSTDPWSTEPHAEADAARQQEQLLALVQQALGRLLEDQRRDFLRHYRDGATMLSLAAERGCTHQAVSQRMARIMERVRREVAALQGEAVAC